MTKAKKVESTKLNKENRVPSGIPGLDKLIQGGFIPGDVYLITGGTGTGKTLFCCQFLLEGLKNNEPGIYFSLEELPEEVVHDAEAFGWDMKKYIDENKLAVEYQDPFEMVDLTTMVNEKISQMGAKRVVIDSTSIFGMVFSSPSDLRKRLYELIKALKKTGAVVLMTAEVLEDAKGLSRYGVEEFVADGIIVLYYTGIGGEEGSNIEIRKMRRTKHARGYYSLEIGKNGLLVKEQSTSALLR